MRKILVGVDLSTTAELAIQHALVLARHTGAEVVLGMATSMPDVPGYDAPGPGRGPIAAIATALADEARRAATVEHTALSELTQRYAGQGVVVSQVIVDGRPAVAIPELARTLGADLIVVGSHGRTGVTRIAMGSVAEHIVRGAPCSVYVARGPVPAAGLRRVLVGTEFEPTAAAMLAQADALVAPGGQLELVTCWRLVPLAGEIPFDTFAAGTLRSDVIEDLTARATALLASAPRVAHAATFQIVEQGAPWGLIEAGTRAAADLLVVGTHGRRGLQRLLLGSVAEATVRHAPCAVLVARPPASTAS